jgi:hypothetical protein
MHRFVAVFLVGSLAIAPALADSRPAKSDTDRRAESLKADDCARARALNKTCELTIEGEQVNGSAPSAGEASIGVIEFLKATSLIRIRRDFIAEILKTAEDL